MFLLQYDLSMDPYQKLLELAIINKINSKALKFLSPFFFVHLNNISTIFIYLYHKELTID